MSILKVEGDNRDKEYSMLTNRKSCLATMKFFPLFINYEGHSFI